MVDRPPDTAILARLDEFLSAERRRAEVDYPHLAFRRPAARRPAAPLGVAVVAVLLLATVVLLHPWGSFPPGAPGLDPLGADGIPLSIGGQPVLRGADIDNHLADPTSFLAGGYLVLHSAPCASAAPAPSPACAEDWRLEDAAGQHSHYVTTAGGSATFVRTSGAKTVLRVKPADEVRGTEALVIEAVAWRQPTKGPVPSEATPPQGGETNMALVPDFVSVLGGPTGETIVGYAPKDLLFNPRTTVGGTPQNPPQALPVPVYGEDLTTIVGHMVPGQGFVALGSSPDPSAALGSPSVQPSSGPLGPLAVIPRQDGADTARAEGTLRITDACVYLTAGSTTTLLFWPADRTMWNTESRAITFRNVDGSVVTVGDGDHVILGGGGDSQADSGISGAAWVKQMDWIAPPAASCSLDPRWGVGAVVKWPGAG
jgi:hypothetical protein